MAEFAPDSIAWFADIGLADRARVGGKGGSLGELERARLPVPAGFVVTAAAFHRFLGACDPDRRLRADVAALRERIEAAPLPEAFAAEFFEAYARLCGCATDDVAVAVRSSATAEDSAGASFAGVQDTFLWTRGRPRIVDALRRCWASLYSDAAVAYRRRLAIGEDDMAMAVVIQRMVEPRSAGVMFTRSPLTGDRSVVAICASWGLGSTVVGGEVTPDEFVVNKITGQIERRTISRKETRHVAAGAGSGIRAEAVPQELQSRPALDEAEILELAALGRRIEQHYGSPQDVEWAIDSESKFFILQSRPETVWSAREREAAEARAKEGPKEKPFQHVLSFFTPPK